MASYGYGYGSFTSQPQQYSAGSFASQTAGSYGYASTQPVSRVVQGFQAGGTGYGQTYAQASVPAASSGGYGYFQRASDPGIAIQESSIHICIISECLNQSQQLKLLRIPTD